jgi:dihydrolipoamide dehydrogenase
MLEQVPGRVVIIGAGAVGCEFASLLADLGTEVTLLEALPRVLPGADEDASTALTRAFAKRGIGAHSGARVSSIEGTRELTVGFESGGTDHTVTVDKVIVSVGRDPRTQGLGVENSGIEIDERGHICVDDHMRTTVSDVYAVGDVVATPQLAHVGFAEAILAIKTHLGEDAPPISYDKVPWGIYCHPEVAYAGLTEAQARQRGHEVVTKVEHFAGDARAQIIGEADGMVKVVAEPDGPILGVHVVGPWATELMAEGYLAVNWEATVADVAPLIHAHPTLSELFGEAALALTGRPLHG